MKRFFSLIIIVFALQALAYAQCPDPNITADGFYPTSDSLDCVERGFAYNEFIQANIPASITTPLGAVTVTSVIINDITGEPNGISHTCTPSNCTFSGGASGCINFSGTTTDPVGQYPLTFIVTVSVNVPLLGAQVFGPDNLDTLLAGLPFPVPGLSDVSYALSVIEQGQSCPPAPPLSVTASATPSTICTGETSTLTATVTNGSGNETFLWSNGSSTNPITVSPNATTTYTVTVTDGGNTATASATVTVDELPVAGFSSSDANMPTIAFTNSSTNAASYSWDFDDGSTGTDPNPTHTYAANGTYTVTLIATNNCESDTTSDDVTIAGVFIGSVDRDLQFSVYPNPSEGVFTISLSDNSGTPNIVKVYDLSGKNVFEETLSGTVQKQLDLSALPKGIYTLHLSSEKSNGVKKLVIR